MSVLLDLSHVSVALGPRMVVRDASLSVGKGEIVALLGANGAGKTSLLRAALGLQALRSGEVKLAGALVTSLSALERARRAAYLPQKPESAWAVSVENLASLGRFAYGAAPEKLNDQDHAAVERALHACAIADLRARAMTELSGGEAMRAHLARALAQEAPLLILDEPTASLDPAQAVGVADVLRRHAEAGGGVLWSTHDVALAARASDRIAILHEGAILALGPARDVLTAENLQNAYGRSVKTGEAGFFFI
jgi:iron complex transport system ATP-binding protein